MSTSIGRDVCARGLAILMLLHVGFPCLDPLQLAYVYRISLPTIRFLHNLLLTQSVLLLSWVLPAKKTTILPVHISICYETPVLKNVPFKVDRGSGSCEKNHHIYYSYTPLPAPPLAMLERVEERIMSVVTAYPTLQGRGAGVGGWSFFSQDPE